MSYLQDYQDYTHGVAVFHSRDNAENSVDEERWYTDEKQDVVEQGHGMSVVVQSRYLPVRQYCGDSHQRQDYYFCGSIDQDG